MLHSLLYRSNKTLFVIASFVIWAISIEAYSDTELLQILYNSDYSQNHYQSNDQTITLTSQEKNLAYYEDDDALQELAGHALRYYWRALLGNEQNYSYYLPRISQHLTDIHKSADYDVRLTANTLRFQFKYSF